MIAASVTWTSWFGPSSARFQIGLAVPLEIWASALLRTATTDSEPVHGLMSAASTRLKLSSTGVAGNATIAFTVTVRTALPPKPSVTVSVAV